MNFWMCDNLLCSCLVRKVASGHHTVTASYLKGHVEAIGILVRIVGIVRDPK